MKTLITQGKIAFVTGLGCCVIRGAIVIGLCGMATTMLANPAFAIKKSLFQPASIEEEQRLSAGLEELEAQRGGTELPQQLSPTLSGGGQISIILWDESQPRGGLGSTSSTTVRAGAAISRSSVSGQPQ